MMLKYCAKWRFEFYLITHDPVPIVSYKRNQAFSVSYVA